MQETKRDSEANLDKQLIIIVRVCVKVPHSYNREVEKEMAQTEPKYSVTCVFSSRVMCGTIIYVCCGLKLRAVDIPTKFTEVSSRQSSHHVVQWMHTDLGAHPIEGSHHCHYCSHGPKYSQSAAHL